jgi:hypothetical protein
VLHVRKAPCSLADGHAQGLGQIASRLRAFVQRAGCDVGRPSRGKQGLKKTYALNVEGKNRDRLLDASKHDIRKYVKRERAKVLPSNVDFWDFECKLGANEAEALVVHFAALMTAIDALVASGAAQFYVDVAAKPGHRVPRAMTDTVTVIPEVKQTH